jgi:hypothetical protein
VHGLLCHFEEPFRETQLPTVGRPLLEVIVADGTPIIA